MAWAVTATAIFFLISAASATFEGQLLYNAEQDCSALPSTLSQTLQVQQEVTANGFSGQIEVTTAPSARMNECILQVKAVGEMPGISSSIVQFEKLQELVSRSLGQSVEHWNASIALSYAAVATGDKFYSVDLASNKSEGSNLLKLSGSQGVCAPLTLASANLMDTILPSTLSTGNLQIVLDPQLQHDEGSKCGMALDVVGIISESATTMEAMELLGELEEKVATTFESTSNVHMKGVNVLLHKPGTKTVSSERGNDDLPQNLVLGIVAGFGLLTLMLAMVAFQRKRHDTHCRDKYAKASQAAQIQRVSMKMTRGSYEEWDDERANLI